MTCILLIANIAAFLAPHERFGGDFLAAALYLPII